MPLSYNLTIPSDASPFLPHRAPMLMVERIISVNDDEKSSIIETTVRDNFPFITKENILESEALIEIMAQAAAAQHGYNLAKNNSSEEKGFIVGIRKFKIFGEVSVGDILHVSVKLGTEIDSLSVVYGGITCNNKNIASMELTVWHGSEQ